MDQPGVVVPFFTAFGRVAAPANGAMRKTTPAGGREEGDLNASPGAGTARATGLSIL